MKRKLLVLLSVFFLLATFAVNAMAEDKPFVTVWKVDATNKTITFPGLGTFTLKYKATDATEYTDLGEVTGATTATRKEIEFPAEGEYEVEASHTITGLYARGGKNREALAQVKQWGTAQWKELANAFEGCKNMDIAATAGVPTLTADVKSLSRTFGQCAKLTADLKDWKVENVEDFTAMFASCALFNADLSSWNVAKATKMANMFASASKFNQDLGNWKDKLTTCTAMNRMFLNCAEFEGKGLKDWNVQQVTNMSGMFEGCKAFKEDLASWKVDNVTDMSSMFEGCVVFTADLKDWKVDNVTDMQKMFKNCHRFKGNVSNWNVAKVKNMKEIFDECIVFDASVKDWNLTALTGEDGEKEIGLKNVNYTDTRVDEILTSWMNKKTSANKPQYVKLSISGSGLYYSSSMATNVATLRDIKGEYKWRLTTLTESKEGIFKFAEKLVTMKRGERKAMPSFEGKFLSHRTLVMQREPEYVAQTWKTTDVTKEATPGSYLNLVQNRDVELVAVFQKVNRPKNPGKHLVQLNVYGSGKGTVTGNLGTVAILLGDNEIENTTAESELTLTPESGSKFTSVTVRSEEPDENNKPTGYYRFGGENVKVKVPQSDKNIVVDVVFDVADVTEFSAPDYKLYTSKTGSGSGKIVGKIGDTEIVQGANTVAKGAEVSYSIQADEGSELQCLFIVEKDTRIFSTSVGDAVWSLKYEDREIVDASGNVSMDPIKRPESKTMRIVVEASPLKELKLEGYVTGTPYVWYVGKTLTADFGKEGQPKLIFEPENATDKEIIWTYTPNLNEEYVDVTYNRAKKVTPEGVKITCVGTSSADPTLTVTLEAVIKEELPTQILVGSTPGGIWTVKEGTPDEVKGQGLELNGEFTLAVQVLPEDAFNKEYEVVFTPADVIESLGDNRYKAVKLADEVTMTVTSKAVATVVNTKKFNVWKTPVTGVEFRNPPATIELSKRTLRLRWNVLPIEDEEKNVKGATITDVKFELSAPDVMKPAAQQGNFTLLKAGKCDITLISLDDETKRATITVEVTAPNTAVEDAMFAQALVAPNPFADQLRIADYELIDGTYELINAQGLVVANNKLLPAETVIETANLPTGVYILRLMSSEGYTRSIKLVKR